MLLPVCLRKEVSDAVLIAGIGVCGSEGRVDAVANLLRREGLSDGVLIAGIGVCGREGRVSAVAALLERKGLNEAVRAVAERVLASFPDIKVVVDRSDNDPNPLARDGVTVAASPGFQRGPTPAG